MGWADEGWPAVLDRWERVGKLPLFRQQPATDIELEELEARVGRTLPPSYRAFLATTNGLRAHWSTSDSEPIDALLPAARIQSLRRPAGQGPVWLAGGSLESLFDVTGNVAEQLLSPDEYSCRGHMLYALKIDGDAHPESYMLLDPLDVDADGEWRAWDGHKETCIKRRSFGDLIDATISNLEQPEQPPFYKYVVDPSPEAQERITLQAELDGGGEAAHKALDRLIELATASASGQVRAPAVWVLLQSKSTAAQDAVLRLVESRPDDTVVVSNALQAGLARQRTARIRAALFAALMSSKGEAYASRIAHSWPELVDEAWHLTGDVRFLNALFEVLYPGSMEAAIEALAGPNLPDQMRFSMCYRLGYSTRPKDASLIEATRRLVEVPQNSRADIARALLGWGEVDLALSIVGESLDRRSSTSGYLIMELIKRAPSAAAPVLIATLRRSPNADVIHALGCIDQPDSAGEVAPHLDGPLREDALLALEQLGTNKASAVLAIRAADGDLEAARALARQRDERALEPLLQHIEGRHRRSAVIGLRDLQHHSTNADLARIASDDPDDNVAAIAAHGLVMTNREHARPTVEVLRQRKDPHVRQLADHWLQMLP